MIAVTIGGGTKYAALARLAAASCRKHTGLPVRILGATALRRQGVRKPHHLKFRLFEECPDADTLLYFDADMVFLKDASFREYADRPEFVCCRDLAGADHIRDDAAFIGIPPADYFNSGLFILNRAHHNGMLKAAEELADPLERRLHEQTAFNAARARLGVPLLFLGREFNFLEFEQLETDEPVVVGHVIGIATRPAETIERYYRYWSREGFAETETVRGCRQRIVNGRYEYRRVGHDSRAMTFAQDGRIGEGAAGCERRWELSEDRGGLTLWIAGGRQPICGLTQDADGVWKGRWMRHEQMPIELRPVGGAAGA